MLSAKLSSTARCLPAGRRAGAAAPVRSSLSRRAPAVRASAASYLEEADLLKTVQFINPKWSTVSNEQQFFEVLEGEVKAGRCPPQLIPLWKDFYNNYRNAIENQSKRSPKLTATVQATIADCTLNQMVAPYTFPSQHGRLMDPYNYYEFGQRYVASLIDFSKSALGQPQRWDQLQAWLDAGHNVVLLANHQTEADPGVFAHMLGSSHPKLATDVIYVAGDRVVTDALCKPFSMGRNLFCVHSKKHMGDDPVEKAAKMDTNRKTLVAMGRRLNEGGALIWIAPSGGRDRPKDDGTYKPDAFDPASVELMRNLLSRAKQPGHLLTMAMFSAPLMPPPNKVEKAVGERRITNWTPVGISLGPELDVAAITAGIEDKEAAQLKLANAAFDAVATEYKLLLEALAKDPATRGPNFVQPWLKSKVMA